MRSEPLCEQPSDPNYTVRVVIPIRPFKKFLSRPLTPTTADLKALDEEVEQKLEKNALKLDDWSEEDPYAGMGAVERIFKKYIMLPRGRC